MCELGTTHMNDTRTRKYKRYDEAFKRSAVEHWLVSGKSGRQTAKGAVNDIHPSLTRFLFFHFEKTNSSA
jgi:hypothetical protein